MIIYLFIFYFLQFNLFFDIIENKGGVLVTYYQILKKRRLDLKLSIQDVSSQTRLAPEYIQAIEENHLDIFSDDYSFVRYFVHSYCDAIGVNWLAIQQEVDEVLRAYARSKDMALTQAQRRMVEQMPSVTRQRGSKSSQNGFQRRVSHVSRKMNWSRKKAIRTVVIIVVVLLLILFGANMFISYTSKQQQAQAIAQQKEELAKKERETEKLAKQRKKEAEKENILINAYDKSNNIYTISNVLEHGKQLDFKVTVPSDTYILLYKDGKLVSQDSDKVYSDTFTKTLKVNKPCEIKLEIGNYSNNEIYINGKAVQFSQDNWFEGYPATIIFEISSNDSSEDSNVAEENATEMQSALNYEESSVDSIPDMYTETEDYYS